MKNSQFLKQKKILETPIDENLLKFSKKLIQKYNLSNSATMRMGELKKEIKREKLEFKAEEV